ncbi:MAG: hypothetical protein ABI806_28105 [Candidatus Solibacter sp.]
MTLASASPGIQNLSDDDPWPGLSPFREVDQQFFHGRETEAEELYRLVMRERLTVLFGLSGLGKSSLLQAGLFPQLRNENTFPVYLRLSYAAEAPDLIQQVIKAIAAQAQEFDVEPPGAKPGETLWEYFHRQENDFWNERNRPVVPLLVFDQFEEAFTLGQIDAERSAATAGLLEQIGDLAEGRVPSAVKKLLDSEPEQTKGFVFSRHPYKILLSLREDFLAELEPLRPRMPALGTNRFRLLRMNGAAALRVVAQPAQLVDKDVAEEIVRFVAADRTGGPLTNLDVEPALLSVVCRELNTKRRSRGDAKITAELLKGSQEQVLEEFYTTSMSEVPPAVRHFVEDRLLTVSGFRDSVALENALSEPGVTREAIDKLVQGRLLRAEERAGVERMELTHDLLTGVVRASRDRRHLLEKAEEERRAVARAQEEAQHERERQDLRRSRRQVTIVSVVSAIAVISALLAVGGFVKAERESMTARDAERQARQAGARALNAAAEAQKSRDQIVKSLEIRGAALSGDQERLDKLMAGLDHDTQVRFTTRSKFLYTTAGTDYYRFEIFPVAGSLPSGPNTIAFITYVADHPTFRNKLMITDASRAFKIDYTGWGCLSEMTALLEYNNPSKPPSVAKFDACKEE